MDKTKWTYNLPEDVYKRLCECRNIKEDLPILVNARWCWIKQQDRLIGFRKVDALVYVLDLLDSNCQFDLTNITRDEYNELKREC